jgi:glycosyltransferase involved in cell wall biosynthesis
VRDLPLVDVVIPTFNGLPYLQSAVESALNQSVKQIRVFIIDDGSTDATSAFAKSINDDRVVYLRQPNEGPSSARNLGIKSATAPFIAFLDSDDIWHQKKLEYQLAKGNEGHGLIYCHQRMIDETGATTGYLEGRLSGRIFDELLKGTGVVGSDSAALIPRKVLESVGGFNESIWFGEDWELWLRIAEEHSIDFVPEYLVGVRSTPGALQTDYRRMAADSLRLLDIISGRFELMRFQRRTLARTCLNRAIVYGLMTGDKRTAWQALRRLVRESPGEALALRNLRRYKGLV